MKSIKPVEVHNVVLGAGGTSYVSPDYAKFNKLVLSVIGTVGQVGGFMIDPMPGETEYLKILTNNTLMLDLSVAGTIYIKNFGDSSMEFSIGLYRDRRMV